MKIERLLTVVLAAALLVPGICFSQDEDEEGSTAKVDLIINALPASLLIEIDQDKFAATSADGRRTTISSVYTMPNISAGAGIEFEDWYVDITAGAGLVINDTFRSFLLQAGVAVTYAVSDSLNIGPRVGVIYFPDPEWTEDDDVKFDESAGWMAGIQLQMGDKIQYLVSVDLLDTSFDTTFEPGVSSPDGDMEITGLAIQFGVRGEF